MRILGLTLLIASSVPTSAWAWGPEGHRIVCEIAEQRLSAKGKALVAEALSFQSSISDPLAETACGAAHADDGRAMSFVAGCQWPDEAREDTFRDTYNFHFVSAPKGKPLDARRDCRRLDCVLIGVQRYARTLAEPARGRRGREEKALALRFLGHFVGDMHQPLHVGNVEDIDGNAIPVSWFGSSQPVLLHHVWDSSILSKAHTSSAQLHAGISPSLAAQWSSFDIAAWATESRRAGIEFAYKQPDGSAVKANATLADAYFLRAKPVVVEQLEKAGVRLAFLINSAADGTLPPRLVSLD